MIPLTEDYDKGHLDGLDLGLGYEPPGAGPPAVGVLEGDLASPRLGQRH